MYICICHAVTDHAIRAAAQAGAASVNDLSFQLGVGTNCGCCRDAAQAVIDECRDCPRGERGQCARSAAALA
jgi:bacterioferritin-associated ferredoxin